jgi:predicted amidohydrolase
MSETKPPTDESSSTEDQQSSDAQSLVTITCVQFEPQVGELEANRQETCRLVEAAAERGSDFVVLPELANSGYVFESRSEARSLAEPIPEGETAQQWIDLAATHDLYIVGGYTERDGIDLYNSAILIGPDGYIGTHRKLHLWNEEKLWFEPGDEIQVFNTEIGRIGMQICYDQWFPELSRIQAAKGADLIAEPTNWVPINQYERTDLAENELARANYLAVSNAHVNTVWFACADRIGVERDQPFLGRSLIVEPTGTIVAGPASQSNEELLIAEECDIMDARTEKVWNELNVIPRDRRTDVYDELLGYDGDIHPH